MNDVVSHWPEKRLKQALSIREDIEKLNKKLADLLSDPEKARHLIKNFKGTNNVTSARKRKLTTASQKGVATAEKNAGR